MKKLLPLTFFFILSNASNSQTNVAVSKIDSIVKTINSVKNLIVKIDSGTYTTPSPIENKQIKQKYRRDFFFNNQKKLVKAVTYDYDLLKYDNLIGRSFYYYSNDSFVKLETDYGVEGGKSSQPLHVYFVNGKYLYSNLPYSQIESDLQSYLNASKRYYNISRKYFK